MKLAILAILSIAGSAWARPDFTYTGPPVSIPDGTGTGTPGAPGSATISVPGSLTISSLTCSVYITHSFQGDLRLTLTHIPSGTSIALVDRPYVPQTALGFPAPDYGTSTNMLLFADTAPALYDAPAVAAPGITGVNGPWKSESPLALFNGRNAQGTWRLSAVDSAAGDTGTIVGFKLSITATTSCYANCDSSQGAPILSAGDFQCFLNRFAAADPWANCDSSVVAPILNINDFQCYLSRFASGCTAP